MKNFTEEHRKHLSEATKRTSWIRGLTKETDERVRKFAEKRKGRPSPWKGKKASEELRKKLSLAHLGQIPWNKGVVNCYSKETLQKMGLVKKGNSNRKGKHSSEETKRKISEIQKGRHHSEETRRKRSVSLRGERSPHWKGGITSINRRIKTGIEYRLWREAVFARDGWTCKECGKVGGKIEAHHIKYFAKYPELRTSIENGITLCVECHHKKGRHNA